MNQDDDEKARKDIEEQTPPAKKEEGSPPAGPHAREGLVDPEKTPGSGSLPDDTAREADVGPD